MGGTPQAAKRVRQPLNCAACRERKIRCDRTVPCSQCIRRGIGDSCHIEDRTGHGARRPRQKERSAEVDDLRERLAQIEEVLGQQRQSSTQISPLSMLGNVPETPVLVCGAKPPPVQEQCDGNEEEAIARLEDLALVGQGENGRTESSSPDEPATRGSEPPDLPGMLSSVHTGLLNIGTESSLGWGLGWAFGAALEGGFSEKPVADKLDTYYSLAPDRRRVLGVIISTLPPKHVADRLMLMFERRLKSLVYNVVHVPTLCAELNHFYDLPLDEQVRQVDGGDTCWLGVVLIMCALSAQFMPREAASDPEYSRHVCTRNVHLWLSATRSVLVLSDMLFSQRLSVLQTIVLLAFQSGHMSRTALVRIAIANAQAMGIHRLGDKARALRGTESQKEVLYREMCTRVWWALIVLDWRIPMNDRTPHSVSPRQFNTPLPRRNNDDELLTEVLPPEHASSDYTDVSFFLAQIEHASVIFQIKERLNELAMQQAADDVPRKLTYSEVNALDTQLRKSIDNNAYVLGFTDAPAAGDAVEVQRWLLHLTVFNSLLHLHRPHIACKRARYCCVELARCILRMQRNIRTHNELAQMLSLTILESFPATLLLCLDMLQVPQHEPQRSALRKEILESLDVLRSANLRLRCSTRVARIIEMLLAKEEAQWAIIQHQDGLLRPLPRNLVETLECVASLTNKYDFECSAPINMEELAIQPDMGTGTGIPAGYVPMDTPFPGDKVPVDLNGILDSLGNQDSKTSVSSVSPFSYPSTAQSSVSQPTPVNSVTPLNADLGGLAPQPEYSPFNLPDSLMNGASDMPEIKSDNLTDGFGGLPSMDVETYQKNNELWGASKLTRLVPQPRCTWRRCTGVCG